MCIRDRPYKTMRDDYLIEEREQEGTLDSIKDMFCLLYTSFGLFIFVAIPLTGTGAWTGALVAAFLEIRLKDAILPIVLGVLTAGILIMMLTYGVTTII